MHVHSKNCIGYISLLECFYKLLQHGNKHLYHYISFINNFCVAIVAEYKWLI